MAASKRSKRFIHLFYFAVIYRIFREGQKATQMSTVTSPESDWLQGITQQQQRLAELLGKTTEEQQSLGYFHTLREILQQPSTWLQTRELMQRWSSALLAGTNQIQSLVMTGSGSSEYVGDCVRLPLQNEVGVVTQALGGGAILAQGTLDKR